MPAADENDSIKLAGNRHRRSRVTVLILLATCIVVALVALWRVRYYHASALETAVRLSQRASHAHASKETILIVDADTLAAECDDYAGSHGGSYAPDVATLRDWLYGNGMNVPDDLDQYIYLAGGIKQADSDARIELLIRKPTPPIERWLIVPKTLSDSGRAKLLSDGDAKLAIDSANASRAALGLPAIKVKL